jgi:DNA-binding XRE family transcriptional regulator
MSLARCSYPIDQSTLARRIGLDSPGRVWHQNGVEPVVQTGRRGRRASQAPDVQAGRQARAMRALLGLKQQDVAIRARVSRTSVVRVEAGLYVLPMTRAAVERVLGIESTSSQPERAAP